MSFCGDPNFRQQIINLLYDDLFKMPSSNGELEKWYDLMRSNLNARNAYWSTLSNIVIPHANDPLLQSPDSLYSASSILPLFAYPNFGHDVPIWLDKCLNKGNEDNDDSFVFKDKRIMIISQDPLRYDPMLICKNIYFSSPFGLHSSTYRVNKLMTNVVDSLLARKDVSLYITDFNKLFVLGPKTKHSEKELSNFFGRGKRIPTFRNILLKEIDSFKPNLIVTLGNQAKNNLIGGNIPVLPLLHPSARAHYWSKCLKGLPANDVNKANHIVQEIINKI